MGGGDFWKGMKKNDYHWVNLLEATHDSEIKKMDILNNFNRVGQI